MEKVKYFLKKTNFYTAASMVLGTVIYCLGIVWILDLGEFYAGGVTGVAQLITTIFAKFEIKISKSLFIAIINVPLFLIAWRGVSRRFAYFSLISVIIQIVLIYVLEIAQANGFDPFVSLREEKMLLAILGGLSTGIGCAICLRGGVSTGGMDILAQYVSLKKNISFTKFSVAVDLFIIVASGILGQSISISVYTVLRLITHMIVLDRIHTIYKFMKITIITTKEKEMTEALINKFNHGITVFGAKGAFSQEKRWVLESIVLAYEIDEYRNLAKKIDEHVFIHYSPVNGITGHYNHNVIT